MGDEMREKRFTRRQALQMALLGGTGLALAGRGSPIAFALDGPTPAPGRVAKARAMIQIWMWGGPSQIDTFDPKPGAGKEYTGPLDSPIATNVDGVKFGQLLPELAQQADKLAVIRSMTHGVNGHETASYITQTGHSPGGSRIVYPCAGAIVSKLKGVDAGYKGRIPPYVVLTRPLGRFSEAGFLGLRYKPFVTGGDPNQARFAVEGIVQQGIPDERQERRRELLDSLDTLGKAIPGDPRFEAFERCEEKAYELILGDAGKVFDLSEEPDELRERYGRSKFGQSCLVARRLVEQGVPFVGINYEGWDTHKQHFEAMNRKLPEMDKGFATLLSDLEDRGLLASTVVSWGGEFGRTPKVMWNEPWNGGRGHHGAVFSSVVAGGGFRGGVVVGSSDETASFVGERPIHPRALLASIYDRLGIDVEAPLENDRGLDVKPLAPPPEGDAQTGPIREILA